MKNGENRSFIILCVLGLVFSFLAGAQFTGCRSNPENPSTPSSLSTIQNQKKIKVGYIIFPPACTLDPNTKEIGGHFVETIREIAKLAGWQVEFVEADWATFTEGLLGGRFDLSIAPTFVTVPRATSVAFTRPLFFAGNSAVVRKGESRFTSINSFDQAGVKIAVTQGEAGHEYAKANFKKAELIVHSGANQVLAFQDVVAGRADAAFGDAFMTEKFASENSDQVINLFAENPYNLMPVSWAVRHEDQELLTFVNNCLDALESQGKLLELEKSAGANWLHEKRTLELMSRN